MKKVLSSILSLAMALTLVITASVFTVSANTITVWNEDMLRQALRDVGGAPATIVLTANIELSSAFSVTPPRDITLTSEGGNMFSLIATGNFDVMNVSGGTVTLNNVGITRVPDSQGRGIMIQNAATLILNDGVISGHGGGTGTGVAVNGTFIMNGGVVRDNTSGGVNVNTNGTFTLNDGMITENTIHSFGAGVNNSGTFIMNGGGIIRNRNISQMGGSGGGVHNAGSFDSFVGAMRSGTFIMNSGIISHNHSYARGGGVHNAGNFTMYGGTITLNTAGANGAGVSNWGAWDTRTASTWVGNFTMNGGIITGNLLENQHGDFGAGITNQVDLVLNGGYVFNNQPSDLHEFGAQSNVRNNISLGSAPPEGYNPQPPVTAQLISVTLNGNPIEFDVPPQMIDNRTMVPLRAIFEALGADIDWNGDTQTVTATRGATVVVMQVGNYVITVDGNSLTLDVPPLIIDNRTLVPARAVAESFGVNVEWNSYTQTVVLTMN